MHLLSERCGLYDWNLKIYIKKTDTFKTLMLKQVLKTDFRVWIGFDKINNMSWLFGLNLGAMLPDFLTILVRQAGCTFIIYCSGVQRILKWEQRVTIRGVRDRDVTVTSSGFTKETLRLCSSVCIYVRARFREFSTTPTGGQWNSQWLACTLTHTPRYVDT